MKLTLTCLATASLLLSLAPDASAQNVIDPRTRRGIMSGAALALVMRGGPTQHILMSPPGNQSSPPAPFNRLLFPNTPDFRLSMMFQNSEDIQLDAISTGNDFIGPLRVIQGQQRAAPDLTNPVPRWQSVHVTVAENAVGLPGGLLKRAPLANQGPEGAVFSHYLEGSAGIPNYLLDATMLEQSSRNLGFPPSSNGVIAGMDWALAVRAYLNVNPGSLPASVVFLSSDNVFYFSVTRNWALNNPNFALDETGQFSVTTSAADVYQITWNGSIWLAPRQYLKASDLGLDPATDDLDALALDAEHDTAIFSTTVTTTSQLRAYQKGNSVLPAIAGLPLASTDNELMTAKLGLKDDSDDVTGICDLDPEPGTSDPFLGVDPAAYGFYKEEIGLSLELTRDKNGKSHVVMQATGTGDYVPTDGSPPPLLIVQFYIVPPQGQPYTKLAWYDEASGSAEWTEPVDPNWPNWMDIEVTALLYDVAVTPTWVGNSYRLRVKKTP